MLYEVITIESFGSQNVLCGGGRYNGLIETLGGPATSGVGFALGFERLLNALEAENIVLPYDKGLDIYVIPMSEEQKTYAFALRITSYNVCYTKLLRR